MLVAMSVFAWLAWTSREEPGIGRVAVGRPSSAAPSAIPDERFEFLAAFEAPDYKPDLTPRKFSELQWRTLHADKTTPSAARALRTVADSPSPDLAAARFYLGVSLLLVR